MEVTHPVLPVPLDEEAMLSFFSESGSELDSPTYLDSTGGSLEDLLNTVDTPTQVGVHELTPLFPSLDLSGFQTLPVNQTQQPIVIPEEGEKSDSGEEEIQSTKDTRTPRKRNTSTNQKQNKRPPKKQKVESEFIRSLHGLTSDELLEYEQTHTLTASQQRELKNWIRKIKNRESALLSRQRKKTYQEELEQRIEFLKKENVRLERETLKLEAQNSVLKTEFLEFQKMISSSTFLSKMLSQATANNMHNPRLQNALPLQNATLQNAAMQNDLRLQFDSVLQNIAPAVASALPAGFDTDKMSKSQMDGSALLYLCIMLYSYASHYASLSNKPLLQSESNDMSIAVQ